MKLFIEPLDKEMAINILNWKYEKPYDFYNNDMNDEDLQEMLDGTYKAVVDVENALIGFFCVGRSAQVPAGKSIGAYTDEFVDMGLGMHPNLVGQGNGYEFCRSIIGFIEEHYENTPIRLTVATFNKRAIRLYEKLGFVAKHQFNTDRAQFETMIRKF